MSLRGSSTPIVNTIFGISISGVPTLEAPFLKFNSVKKVFEWVDVSSGAINFTDLLGMISLGQIPNLIINESKIDALAVTNEKINDVNPDKINQDGATDGQALIWSDANSKYEPKTVSSGGSAGMNEFEYLASVAKGDLPTGVLKSFLNESENTEIIATVPTGKDWYLIKWNGTMVNGATEKTVNLEFPTGTTIDWLRSVQEVDYVGTVKGFRARSGQTITISRTPAVLTTAKIFILEVNTDASIVIPT